MRVKRFWIISVRSLLISIGVVALICGALFGYVRIQKEAFIREDLLPSLRRYGFVVRQDARMMRVDGEKLTIPQLDSHSAVAIVGLEDRYRFEIVGCKVTSEALSMLKHFESSLLSVELVDCEVTAENKTGVFEVDFSNDVGRRFKHMHFGREQVEMTRGTESGE